MKKLSNIFSEKSQNQKKAKDDIKSFDRVEYNRLLEISIHPNSSINERAAANRLLARMNPQH